MLKKVILFKEYLFFKFLTFFDKIYSIKIIDILIKFLYNVFSWFINIYNNPYLALKLAGECAIIRRTWRDVKIMLIYL